MKVIILTHLFPQNNNPTFGTYNFSRAKYLKREGHEVKVICCVGLTPEEKNLFPFPRVSKLFAFFKEKLSVKPKINFKGIEVFNVKWFWLPKRFFYYYEPFFLKLFAGRKIKKIITAFKPDLIITSWMHPFGTYSKYIQKYYNGKIFSIAEGSDVLVMPFVFSSWKKVERNINQSNIKIFFVSDKLKEEVGRRLNLKDGNVLSNGFDEEYFSNGRIKNSSKSFRLISIGHLTKVKGHDILLKAFALLDKNFTLTIIGSGQEKSTYKDFIIKNNLVKRVTLIEKVEHEKVGYALSDHDIFCIPSRSESFGIAPIEAMAMGLPVIGSNVGGLDQLIINGFNGLKFTNENYHELAEKINEACSKEWNRDKISAWAKESYSWSKWTNSIVQYYNNLT
jgi:glycosyltransferase involved in cell wall biosynthesis